MATRLDVPAFSFRTEFEVNTHFPGCVVKVVGYCIVGPSYEGSLIEGAFAAFLYDLTDSAIEPHDSVAVAGTYIVDLIRSCQVKYGLLAWRRANGPDEVAYCVENTINPGSYFSPRGVPPSQYSESATEGGGWTASRARANWTWNLYDKPN